MQNELPSIPIEPLQSLPFEDWFNEQCEIAACEVDSPNSPDFDRTFERFVNDPAFRAKMIEQFDKEGKE